MRHLIVRALVLVPLTGLTACATHRMPMSAPTVSAPITIAVTDAERESLVATALSLVGTPYTAGGATPRVGFDCSGFVTWVFQQHGVTLPRTVAAQFSASRPVGAHSILLPGDLVFFETDAPGPSHVGISLGDGRFVHAPSSRGAVRIEPLGGPYWTRRYMGGRRVLEPAGDSGSSRSRASPARPGAPDNQPN